MSPEPDNHNHNEYHGTPPRLVTDFFWQLLGSVSSAAVVGLFFWLWNVTLDIRDLQNARSEIARAVVQADASRVIIDRNSDRLVKIEAMLDQYKNNMITAENVAESLRVEIRQLRDALNTQIIEFSRLAETVRQLERVLQSRFGEADLPQRYQPWQLRPAPNDRKP